MTMSERPPDQEADEAADNHKSDPEVPQTPFDDDRSEPDTVTEESEE
jgi:hypothetical protein